MTKRKIRVFITDKIFEGICKDISSTSLSIRAACKKNNISTQTFYNYLAKAIELNKTKQLALYARAREFQADILFNEMLNAAKKVTLIKKTLTHCKGGGETDTKKYLTHESIQATRMYIDTLKFMVAKLNPKKYSDTLAITQTDTPTLEETLAHMDKIISEKK